MTNVCTLVVGSAPTVGSSDRIRCLDYDVFTSLRSVRTLVVGAAPTTDPCGLSGGATITYDIDPTGRRIGRHAGTTSTYWLYESRLRIAAQLDGDRRITQRYLYGQRPNVPEVIVTYDPTTGTEIGRFGARDYDPTIGRWTARFTGKDWLGRPFRAQICVRRRNPTMEPPADGSASKP